MDELEAFRTNVRSWLDGRYQERDPLRDDDRGDIIARTPDGHGAMIERAVSFQRELYAAGFAALTVPVEYGGRGLSSVHADVVAGELARVDTPSLRPLGIGLGLALPTIMAAGTEEQKRRF
ncbi:MAG: acyl-CoA dehydrogenase family protein, partial [Acidimicrobiales bacterium]